MNEDGVFTVTTSPDDEEDFFDYMVWVEENGKGVILTTTI